MVGPVAASVRPVAAETRYEAYLLHGFEDGCEALRGLAQAGLSPDVARLSDADETRTTVAFLVAVTRSGAEASPLRANGAHHL